MKKIQMKPFFACRNGRILFGLIIGIFLAGAASDSFAERPQEDVSADYEWTRDHMQVGVRWQPFSGRPENNAADAARPVIATDSSYAQFWVSWAATEPTLANTNYTSQLSPYLKTIEAAVDACVAEGVKVELVFWHCPAWASESGTAGGWRPKVDHYSAFVTRMAEHFKGRVHAYQLYHEANIKEMMKDGDMDFMISEIFIKGARAIRTVYDRAPAAPVLISPAGCSPCQSCPTLDGLDALGGLAVNRFYDRVIENNELMQLVDALNLNVSDQNDGYGNMDGSYISSAWGNYDLVRSKLDAAGYWDKGILAAESWIAWDNGLWQVDVNGDGVINEQDGYDKTRTILGQCLERGLNTANLPWSDNSSIWAMGLTKRRDYNGRIKTLRPEIVIPANDGGTDIVTQKVMLRGGDSDFTVSDGEERVFTIADYINPPDPNHLHYYIWKWYAQIAGGTDEVIRHAMAGELGNDISVIGPGFTGAERYKLSSYNRMRNSFTVLVYSGGASRAAYSTISIPSKIQQGLHYNNGRSPIDFRGEGFENGDQYIAQFETKDISTTDGSDVNPVRSQTGVLTVSDETLTMSLGKMNKFTTITFTKVNPESPTP